MIALDAVHQKIQPGMQVAHVSRVGSNLRIMPRIIAEIQMREDSYGRRMPMVRFMDSSRWCYCYNVVRMAGGSHE